MVGRTGMSRWWAVGMSTLMALSLAAVTGGAAMAQDESTAPAEACAPVEPAGPLPDLTAQLGHKPKVGLVMKSLANEFFQQMQAGAEAYAAENADIFDFEAVGMKDERDFAAQVSAVENYITQQFDVIVIAPADSKAMVEPIARALEAGIKVINIDVAARPAGHGRRGHRPGLLRPGQPRRRQAGRRLARARASARVARSSSSRATPRPTTPCSASSASMTPSPSTSWTSSTPARPTGRPRRPRS